MPEPLIPATLAFDAGGTPYSAAFDDVYHSGEGGPGQARHVFLQGNGLPERWRLRARFTILETGFGFGLNFLATWAAWKAGPGRCTKLHYVSVEKHPFTASDLARLHASHTEFAPLSRELLEAWPMLVPGMHRLELDGGRVVLTLCFADVAAALPQLRLAADAIYLDGFSPAKNPDMWSAPVLRTLARLSSDGATFATYTAAAAVRDALASAGFSVEKRPGFARKRDMLCGRFTRAVAPPAAPARRAMVIGAGLAGSAVCERLASRGWETELIERRPAPAMEASGNHAGAMHPLITRDDSLIAQLSRAAFLFALRHWKALDGVARDECGVLQMPRTDDEERAQRAALGSLGYPPEYVRWLEPPEATGVAGAGVGSGGLWFEHGGWVRPPSLVAALLAKAKADTHFGVKVESLVHSGDCWRALDAAGRVIASAPVVVLANAHDALRLAPVEHLALRSVRGQISHLPAAQLDPIRAVLLRGGMVLPCIGGISVAGASYDVEDADPETRNDSHEGNLARIARILPGAIGAFDPASLEGRVGFRAVAPDRLPVVGPDPRSPGLHFATAYASRGILWCSLMAELLASGLESEPLPVPGRLADAVAPARFMLRAQRRGAGSMDLRSR